LPSNEFRLITPQFWSVPPSGSPGYQRSYPALRSVSSAKRITCVSKKIQKYTILVNLKSAKPFKAFLTFHTARSFTAALNRTELWNLLSQKNPIHILNDIKPLNPELNPICYLLALLGAHHFLHVSRIRVKILTFRRLMSYIYGAPILDVSRSHTTTQHSR